MEEPRIASLLSLLGTGHKKSYIKNQLIQSTDYEQSLCVVESGYVKRYLISNEGTIGVQSIYGPGNIFPLTLVFDLFFDYSVYDGPETYYYEAMCDTRLRVLENAKLTQAVENNPLLYRDLLFVAGRRLKSNIQRLENIHLHSSYQRVAHQLAYFARYNGKQQSSGSTRIKIPLTQQDIADCLSTTRETVSVAFSTLRKKGLIKTGKYISVPNIKKLEAEAYGPE